MCCLSGQAHGGPWDLLGNSWARNTANISRRFMCHERCWSFHRLWLERPSKIAPQPVREASGVNILRRHEAPSTGPWDRNQGFFHITKARKRRRMTLTMQKGLPLGENPLVLSHHCRYLVYSSPTGIMLDAAAIRPNSLWNCLTVSDWPSLILFTADRMDSIRAGDIRSPILRQGRWSSVVEKAHSFWHLAVSPTLSCGPARHLDSALPTDATELESTNRRMEFIMRIPWNRRGTRAASVHFLNVRGDNARLNGRTRYWYALPPKANLRNLLWHGRIDKWKYAS